MAESWLNPELIGERGENGDFVRPADFSILPPHFKVQPGDVRINIAGTPHFYYIAAAEFQRMKPEERQAIHEQVQHAAERLRETAAVPSADYDTYDLDALKAMAADRSVDISGRRTKPQIISALVAADTANRLNAGFNLQPTAADQPANGEAE